MPRARPQNAVLSGLLAAVLAVGLAGPAGAQDGSPAPGPTAPAAADAPPPAVAATPAPTLAPLGSAGADAQTVTTTGRVLVRFRPGTSAAEQAAALSDAAATADERHRGFVAADPTDASAAVRVLGRRDDVVWAEPEVVYPRLEVDQPERAELNVPAAVQAAAAAGENLDGAGVTVAVIDDGVNPANPDLVGRVTAGGSACPDASTVPSGWHGTAVAALAAAAADGQGIVGTAPAATVRAYKVFCDPTGGASSADVAVALQAVAGDMAAAIAAGGLPWVVNLSLGDRFQSRAVQDGVDKVTAAGGTVVAAAGNDGGEQPNFPAGGRHVLSVGATELRAGAWRAAAFSTRGSVDVLAPGAEISTWDQSGGIGRVTGTSFASPQIAGLAAALLGRGVGGSAVRALLASTTAAAHDGAPYAAANGTGRVDALAAYQTWAARRAFSSVFPIGGNVVPTGGHLVGVEVLRYDPDPGVAPDDPSGLEATAGFSVTSGPGSVPGATTRPDDARGGRLVQLLGTVRTIGSDVADGSLVSGHPGEVFRAQPVRVLDESDSRFGRPTRSGRSTAAVLAYGRRSQLLTRIRLTVRDTVSVRASLPPAAGLSPFDPAAALCVWSPVGYGDVADGTELPDCVDGLGPAVDVSFKAPETGTYLVGTVAFDSRADGRHVVTTLVQSPTTTRVRAPAYSSPTQRTDGFGYRYTVSGAGYANRVAGFDVQVAHRQRTRTGRWVTSPWRAVGARRAATQPVSELLRGARPGNTYLLRARAVDAVGNVGRWSPAVATDVPLDDRTRGVTWSRNAARVHCPESPTTGSVACYGRLATGVDRRQRPQAFTANLTTDTRRFGVLATRCPTCGTLTVYVDGRPRRTVSLHAATTRYRQMVYSSPLLTPTTRRHSLRLVARTTAGRYRIQVDGIRLTR